MTFGIFLLLLAAMLLISNDSKGWGWFMFLIACSVS